MGKFDVISVLMPSRETFICNKCGNKFKSFIPSPLFMFVIAPQVTCPKCGHKFDSSSYNTGEQQGKM